MAERDEYMGSLAAQDAYDPLAPLPRNPARDIPEWFLPNLSRPETYGPRPPPTMDGPGGKIPTSDPRVMGALVDLGSAAYNAMPFGGAEVAGAKLAVPLLAAGLRRGVLTGAKDVAEAVPTGIRAFHSSPHDFERFDLSKIGTGEGAQVYGHGIYAAENPAVSGQGGEYWRSFLRRFEGTPEGAAAEYMNVAKFDRDAALKLIDRDIANIRANPAWRDVADSGIKSLQTSARMIESGKPVGPRTYEVNIKAQPEQFLDWDKPLSAQPQAVRELAGKIPTVAHDPVFGRIGMASPTGEEIYNRLATRAFGGPSAFPEIKIANPVATSSALAERGIPGIRYLDQGSRNLAMLKAEPHEFIDGSKGWRVNGPRGDQTFDTLREANDFIAKQGTGRTSNYVVFDPARIDILRKYGLAGAVPTMGALAAQDRYTLGTP